MNPYTILMFIFSGALLLYAGLLWHTKSMALIPRSDASNQRNARAYAEAVAKMVAVAALAPMSSGFYALIDLSLGAVSIIVGLPLSLWIGYQLFGKDLY